MVTDSLISLFAWVLGWLFGLFPSWQWPSGLGIPNATSFYGVGLPVGQIIDVSLALSCAAFILASSLVGAGVKLVRILISHVTGGGGMA